MATATASPPIKGGVRSGVSQGLGGFGATRHATVVPRSYADGNVSEKVKEIRRFTEESHRYRASLGYTEETFMEMVNEEIRNENLLGEWEKLCAWGKDHALKHGITQKVIDEEFRQYYDEQKENIVQKALDAK